MSYPCLNCLTSYSSEQILENHKLMCEEHKATKIIYSHNDYHQLDKWCFKDRVPFTMYCDIESFNTESNTQKPFCYNLVIKSSYPDLMKEHEVTYMGKDCGEHLANTIIKYEDKFKKLLKENIIMDEESVTGEPTFCFYCNKKLGEDIVRDHDHFNGKLRGYAHNICNLNSKKPDFVPLYFYNGSKYDIHLFIKELAITKLKMKALAKTEEEFFSLDIGCIRILDAFRFFTPLSLDVVAKTLGGIQTKGVYPYD